MVDGTTSLINTPGRVDDNFIRNAITMSSLMVVRLCTSTASVFVPATSLPFSTAAATGIRPVSSVPSGDSALASEACVTVPVVIRSRTNICPFSHTTAPSSRS